MGQSQPLIKLIGSRVILVFFLYPIHHANKRSLSHDLLLKWVGCYHVHWLLRIKHRHYQHNRISCGSPLYNRSTKTTFTNKPELSANMCYVQDQHIYSQTGWGTPHEQALEEIVFGIFSGGSFIRGDKISISVIKYPNEKGLAFRV